MILREELERREHQIYCENAAKSDETRGRKREEKKCSVRTEFQRDRDKILHSKAFRRLMHKTQVFLAPEGDHFRTRLTHTLEVSQIARTIARGLALNEDLTEAIALGHDLGHTPFGHNGEDVLNIIHKKGFKHNIQSLRVVDVLETHNGMRGMNLTEEVRDGIVNHTGKIIPYTLEGQVVKISDRIAYINHDIDDALRSGVIMRENLPAKCVEVLGNTHSERINALVVDMIKTSEGKEIISQSDEFRYHMNKLRDFMFENVYHNEEVKKNEKLIKVERIINTLYNYYMDNPSKLPQDYQDMIPEFGIDEMVKDYVAGMTDRYSTMVYESLVENE